MINISSFRFKLQRFHPQNSNYNNFTHITSVLKRQDLETNSQHTNRSVGDRHIITIHRTLNRNYILLQPTFFRFPKNIHQKWFSAHHRDRFVSLFVVVFVFVFVFVVELPEATRVTDGVIGNKNLRRKYKTSNWKPHKTRPLLESNNRIRSHNKI